MTTRKRRGRDEDDDDDAAVEKREDDDDDCFSSLRSTTFKTTTINKRERTEKLSTERETSGTEEENKNKNNNEEDDRLPQCIICHEVPTRPVRLPCKCANTLLCLDPCFEALMKYESRCPVCRDRIVAKVRRRTTGRAANYEVLVDSVLEAKLASAVGGGENATKLPDAATTTETEEERERRLALKTHVAPEPGELQQELRRLHELDMQQKRREEEATRALLEELLKAGDPDMGAVNQLQEDERLARKLQDEAKREEERMRNSAVSSRTTTTAVNGVSTLTSSTGTHALQRRNASPLATSAAHNSRSALTSRSPHQVTIPEMLSRRSKAGDGETRKCKVENVDEENADASPPQSPISVHSDDEFPPPDEKILRWSCSACTFSCAPTAKECEMCGTRR